MLDKNPCFLCFPTANSRNRKKNLTFPYTEKEILYVRMVTRREKYEYIVRHHKVYRTYTLEEHVSLAGHRGRE